MSKILIIGLDGATWTILKPLIQQGIMPTLEAMITEGSSGNLKSVIPPVTAAAWSSFMTGKRPDKHGVLGFRIFDTEKKSDHITNGSCIKGETIWQIASRHGRRIIVLNLPYTYPVYEVNGILVSGMDTPSRNANYCYPPEAKEIIAERFPDYTPAVNIWNVKDAVDEKRAVRYIRDLAALVDLRTELFLHLLSENEWNLAMIHQQETDYLQHVLWDKVREITGGKKTSEPLSTAIGDFYAKIDHSLARIFGQVSTDETTSLIVSDHGCVGHKGVIYPNVLFENRGLLVRVGSGVESLKKKIANSNNPFTRKLVSLFKKGKAVFRDTDHLALYQELKQDSHSLDLNWGKSRAVMVMGNQYAFIYVKRKKDIPLCREILLREHSRFPNEKLFQDVFTFTEAYQRKSAEDNNLLVAIPAEGFSVSRKFAGESVRLSADYPGIHHPAGIFAARGKDISRGKKCNLDLVDIAPTCLHLLDLPIPADMDGKVARTIVATDREARIEKSGGERVSEIQDYDQKSKEIVEERLRLLGYIE